jgi:hypothetical protein
LAHDLGVRRFLEENALASTRISFWDTARQHDLAGHRDETPEKALDE